MLLEVLDKLDHLVLGKHAYETIEDLSGLKRRRMRNPVIEILLVERLWRWSRLFRLWVLTFPPFIAITVGIADTLNC